MRVEEKHLVETLKIKNREDGFRYRNKSERAFLLNTRENNLKMVILYQFVIMYIVYQFTCHQCGDYFGILTPIGKYNSIGIKRLMG